MWIWYLPKGVYQETLFLYFPIHSLGAGIALDEMISAYGYGLDGIRAGWGWEHLTVLINMYRCCNLGLWQGVWRGVSEKVIDGDCSKVASQIITSDVKWWWARLADWGRPWAVWLCLKTSQELRNSTNKAQKGLKSVRIRVSNAPFKIIFHIYSGQYLEFRIFSYVNICSKFDIPTLW